MNWRTYVAFAVMLRRDSDSAWPLAVYFFVVLPVNKLMKRFEKPALADKKWASSILRASALSRAVRWLDEGPIISHRPLADHRLHLSQSRSY